MAVEMVNRGTAPANVKLHCKCRCGSVFNLVAGDLVSQSDYRGTHYGNESPYVGKCLRCEVCDDEICAFELGHVEAKP